MLDFLSTIADSIGLFIHFIGTTVSGLIQVFALASRSLTWLTVSLGYMPSVFVGFAMAGILLTILFFILNR